MRLLWCETSILWPWLCCRGCSGAAPGSSHCSAEPEPKHQGWEECCHPIGTGAVLIEKPFLLSAWAGAGNGALEEAASHAWTTLSCSSRWDLGWFPTLAEPKAASAFPPEFLLLGNDPAGVGDAAVSSCRQCQGLHAEHCVWHHVRSLCHCSLLRSVGTR